MTVIAHLFRALGAVGFAASLAACTPEQPEQSSAPPQNIPIGQGFDFYVLALSWSPGYCASEGDRADKRQCGEGRRYQFVVHGLWPQFERSYPQNCDSRFGDRVDNDLAGSMTDIMPSFGLIRHQWRKHGRCSGLSQQDYFVVTRAAFNKINIPPSFNGLSETKTITPQAAENLFKAANESIPLDGMAATCKRNYLRDVRICLTKDLASFRSCREVDRNFCRSGSMAVAPIR